MAMAYWSSEKLRERVKASGLVEPYDEMRVAHCAYELGVGNQAFVTSNPSDNTLVAAGAKIVIPPGQFGLLITQESIVVPNDCIAFISIRAM
jgi:dCTP deaminase